MTEEVDENTDETKTEPQELKRLPSTYDRYEGKKVVLQLFSEYYPVTYPGLPHHTYVPIDPNQPSPPPEQVDERESLQAQNVRPAAYSLPIVSGLCELDKDEQGNVRIVIIRHDPDIRKNNMVEVSFHPNAISSITLATEESRILAGSG